MVSYETGWDGYGNYHSRRYEDGVLVSDIITSSAINETIDTSGSGSNIRTSAYDSTANDTTRGGISNYVSDTTISGTRKSDSLNNFVGRVTIYGGEGNDTIYNGWFGDSAMIKGGSNDDVIYNYDTNVTIKGGSGNDNILTTGKTTVISSAGNDTVSVREFSGDISRAEVFIDTGDGKDSISMAGFSNSTVIAGIGDDTIYSYGGTNRNRGNVFFGEDGNDYIFGGGHKTETSGETIIGGKGNDTIEVSAGTSGRAVIHYADGDGDDVITDGFGFISFQDDSDNPKNKIFVAGEYSTLKSGSDLVVKVGSGSITLKNVGQYALSGYQSVLNIETMQAAVDVPTIDGSDDDSDDLASENSYVALNPDLQDDEEEDDSHWYDDIIDKVVDVVDDAIDLIKEGASYVYKGGTKLIKNYVQGEQINLATDFLGLGLDENNFYINSSLGSLSIQNARGKHISYGDANGNLIAYSYMSEGEGEIDGRSLSQFQVIIGANNANNNIIAGSGGSSLWGGNGGSDTLTGGDGYDEFFYALGSGDDVIQNASDNDLINLLGVSLDQLTYANIGEAAVTIGFVDGGNLSISGSVKAGFSLGGHTYACDFSTKTWYIKT